MRRRLLDALVKGLANAAGVLGAPIGICAVIGSPIAIILLLLAPRIRWWRATLENHPWLLVVLVLVFLSHFVVGGYLYYSVRQHLKFLTSPEGKRRRSREIQEVISQILCDAKAQPILCLDEAIFDGVPPASIMTEARRLAKSLAKNELRRRGIRATWEVNSREIAKIADAYLETDPDLIATARANLERRAVIPDVGSRPRRLATR